MICCLLYNNAFAVKPVHNPTSQMETPSMETVANSSISDLEKQSGKKMNLKEKIYLKILQKKLKKTSFEIPENKISWNELTLVHKSIKYKTVTFQEGEKLSVRTRFLKRHTGALRIVDDEHISINTNKIALVDITSISHKRKKDRKKGIIATAIGVPALIISRIGLDNTDFNENRTLSIVIRFLFIPLSIIFLLVGFYFFARKKSYTYRQSVQKLTFLISTPQFRLQT